MNFPIMQGSFLGVLALFVAMCQANKFLIKTGSNGEDTDYEEKAEKKKIQIHAPVGRLTKDQSKKQISVLSKTTV